MERLFIYLHHDVLKARQAYDYEKFTRPVRWKKMEFEYTTSSLLMINWPIILPELSVEGAQSLLDLVGARYPFSPHHEQLKAVCPELIFSLSIKEWIFFGGSFNPWHKGHQACLSLLPEEKFCFILPDYNPQKKLLPLEPVSKTIELVTKIKFGKNHFIAPSFLVEFEKNPTITWVEKFKKSYPDNKISLLMGFDSFRDIIHWIRASELLPLLSALYVVSRLEDDLERSEVSGPIQKIAPSLMIDFLGRHEFESLSSTQLRNQKVL